MRPFGFTDYVRLQKDAKCVLSDSGNNTAEAALLDLRAVNLREVHERPEGMDSGTLVMAGLNAASVLAAIEVVTEQKEAPYCLKPPEGLRSVSAQAVRVVMSYIPYVRRTVWRQS